MPFITQGKTNWKFIVIVIFFATIFGGGILAWYYFGEPQEEVKIIECAVDAKLCPDGSYVYRTVPNCEFALCPTANTIESYTACGCGCCGGVKPITKCIYKSKGDDIQKIIEQDRAAAKNPDCPMVGCSQPVKYIYCD